jgi:hypothetical protein
MGDMDEKARRELLELCVSVLKKNDHKTHITPAGNLYPHQWLWDSCFIAIGLRHLHPERAKEELLSLLRGQWANGMLPNMIFDPSPRFRLDRNIWQSWVSPYAPDSVATSGITQPPVLADAAVRVGEKLPKPERIRFYKQILPALVRYHTWLYAERDPHHQGLTLQIHPWEVGLDNTPPWMVQLREHHKPWWAQVISFLHLEHPINKIRRDTRHLPPGTRMNTVDAMLIFDVIRRMRRKNYEIDHILHRSLFIIEDLVFNSILTRANSQLRAMAKTARIKLPAELLASMKLTETALDKLWDEQSGQYYSRDFITFELLREPTIATLMPLYAGTIDKDRAARLVELLTDHRKFWLHHPVPSVPLNSTFFSPQRYWQGPTWLNTNWLIIDGLRRYGYDEIADELTRRSLEMVANAGCFEYFSPIDGTGIGSPSFSWTAALTIDLLEQQPPAVVESSQDTDT